jgi:hypothetical protein
VHFHDRGHAPRSGPRRALLRCLFSWALLSSFQPGLGRADEPPVQEKPAAAADSDAHAAPKDEPTRRVRVHYMWTNERRHDLFFRDLKDLQGGYLGVGGDQNYTLAAAAGSQILWLIDLDAAVTNMHRLYAALLANAATSKEFLRFFGAQERAAVHSAVTARYPDPVVQRPVLEVYHAYRDLLGTHLRDTAERPRGSTWLSDATKYQHLRELALTGRIVARVGDLTGPRTMLEIGEAARRAALPVRVVYLSNAESWFRYGPEFRRNVSAMFFDDKSVVLRTVKSQLLRYPSSDIWHYSLQRAQHFAEGLGRPAYRSVDVAMLDAVALPRRQTGLSHIGFPDERGQQPVLVKGPSNKGAGKEARRALLAAGLVTRPAGNREKAREMDPERLRRAALELSGDP